MNLKERIKKYADENEIDEGLAAIIFLEDKTKKKPRRPVYKRPAYRQKSTPRDWD